MAEQPRFVLCPYCGTISTQLDRCVFCKGFFEPLSRRATQIAMGPWFVRDKANPFRPGCTYAVIRRQIEMGRIKPTTIMRGPTTRQFWTLARATPGVAHLLGYCHRCGIKANPTDPRCPSCRASFKEPKQRNELGLAFPTETVATAAQKALDRDRARVLAAQVGAATAAPGGASSSVAGPHGVAPAAGAAAGGLSSASMPGADLLDEVLSEIPGEEATADRGRRKRRSSRAVPSSVHGAEAIDFTPVDAAASESGDGAGATARPASGASWSIIAMLVLVVVILIGVIVWLFTIVSSLPKGSSTGTPSPGAAPVVQPAPPTPRVDVVPAPKPVTSPRPAAAPAKDVAAMSDQSVKARITEAQLLEDEGKVADALAILQAAVRGVPVERQPREIQTEIRRLQLQLEKENSLPAPDGEP